MNLFPFQFLSATARVWIFTLISIPPLASAADQCSITSGSDRVALVELYTSEGCSSCPPADQWLGNLATHPELAASVIPLALHVDYWDYIGWKDRFANPQFAERQREMAVRNTSAQVYTPQVAINGKAFRAWSSRDFQQSVWAIHQLPATSKIHVSLTQSAKGSDLQVSAEGSRGMELYVAIYQNNLTSEIKQGENQGRSLHHNNVVREWYGPIPVSQEGQVVWQKTLNVKADWVENDLGVVAFVQNPSTGEIMQAANLPWCHSSQDNEE